MKIKNYIKDAFLVLKTPSCWFREGRLDKEWDSRIINLIDNHKFNYKFDDVDGFLVKMESIFTLGEQTILVDDNGVNSFTEFEYPPLSSSTPSGLAKRSTLVKLHNKWIKDVGEVEATLQILRQVLDMSSSDEPIERMSEYFVNTVLLYSVFIDDYTKTEYAKMVLHLSEVKFDKKFEIHLERYLELLDGF